MSAILINFQSKTLQVIAILSFLITINIAASNCEIQRIKNILAELNGDDNLNTPWTDKTDQKIIGVITQPSSKHLKGLITDLFTDDSEFIDEINNDSLSFFASSYSKWLKKDNIFIVPLDTNQPISDLMEQLNHVNAIMLPGGVTQLLSTTESDAEYDDIIIHRMTQKPSLFASKVFAVLDFVRNINKQNERQIPVFGTCLGFELIVLHSAFPDVALTSLDDEQFLTELIQCDPEEIKGCCGSNPFIKFADINSVSDKKLFYFNHKKGLSVDEFGKRDKLKNQFDVVAVMHPKNEGLALPLVAAIQHKEEPIFGVQFHPEKNEFERHLNLPNDLQTLEILSHLNDQFFNRIQGSPTENDYEFWKENLQKFDTYKALNTGAFSESILFKEKKSRRLLI